MSRPSKTKLRTDQPFDIGPELEQLMVPIADLIPYPGNPRRGDLEVIKESLRRNGLYKPIVVRAETSEILVGNHTTKAALELGATAIAATRKSVPNDQDAHRIMLADNATSDKATYDRQALAAALERLVDKASTKEGLEGSGFDLADYTKAMNRAAAAAPEIPDPQPKPKRPTTREGDLIEMGDHRLVCGDSTKRADVQRALAGDQVDMVWTDPPYGIDYENNLRWRVAHGAGRKTARQDGAANNTFSGDLATEYEPLLAAAMGNAREATVPGGPFYLAHAASMADPTSRALAGAGWEWRQTLVWVKNTATFGRSDYQWRHEAIAYGWKPGAHHRWYGEFDKNTVTDHASRGALEQLDKDELVDLAWQLLEAIPGTVVRIDRPSSAALHPTMKPPDMIAQHIRNSSPDGGIVYEPFGGSGSTLVAAEATGRRARLVELEPGYCDVIVARWEEMTGQRAKRRRQPARRTRQ